MLHVKTIGIYGFSLPTFMETLHTAGVSQLIDVRQRRGVRGAVSTLPES
ncbi:putative protein OS=Tsukamurella paurometabola (strain ATCC 8368 / DSM / CCUG 35730 /CIP 100753 / JCM 10117 / KCTC 9821 / NBRC 16120 / NCIMB 702349/ NCTC 13040) OX=521096 GN=Tpau_1026 PE=4 SV=1 [Tsukamurella paurometabola]|uniref:Uncharacterized protein n=1 Tax=Tsukamurella paurometabola (strain ATCC 8368 / DSM 20162 / CCUG 35730 / CIP 100753 / JCM 10117 / KCTC 9821 / NBRC 16120 / NCIMB 702349 / NCTC 13040) TaxID=521096 RepID=D5UV69_TSUPD|nr:hypothetical protein [Tsukamurella paurometabola]ADG77659.1 hypothetical protein Tpau_1026 [Tsukamurella paurometabola DSM 20162]SUP28165.1 Uncharacterised protein [Tsukamurella paurometabola]